MTVCIFSIQIALSSSDEESIKAVLLDELNGFLDYDHERWSKHWLKGPGSHYIFVSSLGYQHDDGWEAFNERNKDYFEKRLWEGSLDIEKYDFDIQNYGNSALVTFKDKVISGSGKDKSIRYFDSHAVLVKDDNDWKITLLSAIDKSSFEDTTEASIESNMNMYGYQFLAKKNYTNAIKIFKMNVELFPESSNVYDSLGEAYMKSGNKELAIKNYKKSLDLDPKNDNAEKMIKKLSN
jgi:tetratricopeptide (TPR) repeat protein